MKGLALFVFLLISFCGYTQFDAKEELKILSIDSINYYFVLKCISMRDKDTVIILSHKEATVKRGKLVRVGNSYFLSLNATSTIKVGDGDKDIITLPLRKFYIDGKLICTGRRLPYFSENLS